jgi:hypothetical protein
VLLRQLSAVHRLADRAKKLPRLYRWERVAHESPHDIRLVPKFVLTPVPLVPPAGPNEHEYYEQQSGYRQCDEEHPEPIIFARLGRVALGANVVVLLPRVDGLAVLLLRGLYPGKNSSFWAARVAASDRRSSSRRFNSAARVASAFRSSPRSRPNTVQFNMTTH